MRVLMGIAVFLAPNIALAQNVCDDLWLSRNIIYDAHGYCFGSPLGKSVFSNDGCSTSTPSLPQNLADQVDRIWQRAHDLQCNTDQSKKRLKVLNVKTRFKLELQPMADETETACLNYLGKDGIPLRAAPNETSSIVGAVMTGDDLGWYHENHNEWSFVTIINSDSGQTSSGWTMHKFNECGIFAS